MCSSRSEAAQVGMCGHPLYSEKTKTQWLFVLLTEVVWPEHLACLADGSCWGPGAAGVGEQRSGDGRSTQKRWLRSRVQEESFAVAGTLISLFPVPLSEKHPHGGRRDTPGPISSWSQSFVLVWSLVRTSPRVVFSGEKGRGG